MGGKSDHFDNLTTLNPTELLESLQSYPFLESYSLALFCEQQGFMTAAGKKPAPALCSSNNPAIFCDEVCRPNHESILFRAISNREPTVFRCKTGLLNFVVPFRMPQAQNCCLLGGGVRTAELNLESVEVLAREKSLNGMTVLEELEKLPTSSEDELMEVAHKAHQLIPTLQGGNLYTLAFEKTMMRLNAIIGISPELDRAESVEQVLQLAGETLAVLFDISRAGVVLTEGGDGPKRLRCLGQWLDRPVALNDEQAALLFRRQESRKYHLEDEDPLHSLPRVKGHHATCLPLVSEGKNLGSLVVFDDPIHPRDLLLIELLAGRTATRLLALEKNRESSLKSTISDQVIEMISNLSLLDNQEALFKRILEMSADLLHASKGSLMVVEDDRESLRIEASIGMNQELARSMRVRVGSGIAGRVVSTGHPLLVNDIEKDERVRSANRPRFKTKSFISVPLVVNGNIFAVLNLSDKENEGTFSEADLRLLTTFSPHFAALIERTASLERATALEELSVTDPLTGLYNRRFLERRMEEEISRCLRQDLALTILLLDLDNFKHYNDLCGHLAGDKALKRTARILQHSAREMDIVTRFGGEEFCILLPGTSKKESLLVAERIRHAIEKEPFPREKSLPLGKLTASMGVATFPADGNTPRNLVNAADIALYRAKTEGRNRTVLFDPSQKSDKISLA